MRGLLSKPVAIAGLAARSLGHHRLRTVLGICGIALAVLALTLLAGIGMGVLATGEEQFDRADGDLWLTGPAAEFTFAGGGGFENTIEDSHDVAATVRTHEGVRGAGPMAFQSVLIGTGDGEYETVIGTGIHLPAIIDVQDGPGFSTRDEHYADGSYDGPKSHEVVLDPATAEMLDVEVGDTVQVGGTIRMAEEHEYEVVGISSTIETFLGAPTVVLHLSELQSLTGTAHRDRAALVVIELEEGADAEAVRDDLDDEFPAYTVRTNEEQLQEVLRMQSAIIAGGVSLVGAAVVAGVALAANMLAMLVFHQRRELAAMKALGMRSRSLIGLVVAQGALLGMVGGLVGMLATPPLAALINTVGAATVGFEELVRVDARVLVGGFVIAVAMGTIASAIAAWRIDRLPAITRQGGRT